MIPSDNRAVIWPEKPPWMLTDLLIHLQQKLQGRVDTAYLIGSYAEGSADSDVDLILVTQTQRYWPERARDFIDLYEDVGDVDLIIYTPEEWQKLQQQPSAFIQHVQLNWVQIL